MMHGILYARIAGARRPLVVRYRLPDLFGAECHDSPPDMGLTVYRGQAREVQFSTCFRHVPSAAGS